ncbi:MAG: hypothetical protein WCF84_05960 [Anaerolineae bacterium]
MLHPRRATRAEEQAQQVLADTGMIPPELMDYMTWRMMEEWRDEEDDKPIRITTALMPALNKSNSQIVDAICHSLNLSSKGRRNLKAAKIGETLTDPVRLHAIIAKRPIEQRLELKRVLDAGGWIRLAALTEEFGSQTGDQWFWNEKPPTSTLGQLRVHGLVFIGQALIGKKKTHVAVVPTDLRAPLSEILLPQAGKLDALGNYNLARTLDALDLHYDTPPWQTVLAREWVEPFIRETAAQSQDAARAWEHLEHFDYFLSRSLVRELGEPGAIQIGVWLTRFLPIAYIGEFPIAEKRAMGKTVAAFYGYLAERQQVSREIATRVAETVEELVHQKGEIAPVEAPLPTGGQVILEGYVGKELVQFTYNDRWLLLACAIEFDQDINALYQATTTVVDGATKRQLITRLASFTPDIWNKLVDSASRDEGQFAAQWFRENPVVRSI